MNHVPDSLRNAPARRGLPCGGARGPLALALGLALWAAPARAVEPGDVVLDPATGLEWLKVSESVGRSYDDLVGLDGSDEFAPGGDFEGFRHATLAEAETWLGHAGFDVLATPSASLLDEARSLMLRLGGPTLVDGDVERLFGVTGTSSLPGSRDRIQITVDNGAGTGDGGSNGALQDDAANGFHGHLLVRDAEPLPQRYAYVARSSQAGIAVIDVATHTVIDTVETGERAVVLVVSPDQRRVYTLDLFGSSVSVIDTATRSVVATYPITTSGSPRGLEISADGTTLFVTDQDDPGDVQALDAATGAFITEVAVDRFPYALQRSADGTEIFATSPNTLEIDVIDVDTLANVGNSGNENFASFGLDVGLETGRIYSARSQTLYGVEPMTLTAPLSAPIGADTRGVAASERIGRVFASSNDDATVTVIDIPTFAGVTTIPTGAVALHGGILAPGIDVAPEGDVVYAAQGDNDTVVAIDTLSNQVVAEIAAGTSPMDVVFVPEPAGAALGAVAGSALMVLRRRRR